MSQIEPSPPPLDDDDRRIKAVLTEARGRAGQAVNAAMVAAYREVGRIIVEVEQAARERAEHGGRVLEKLSVRLTSDFGKGFDRTNLKHMRSFYLA
jgi:hypothetical protein